MSKDSVHDILGFQHKSRLNANDTKKQFLLVGRLRVNIFDTYTSKPQTNQ